MKIISGIITYNPDLDKLEENVSAIEEQVDTVLFIDNASSNIDVIKERYGERLIIIENKKNMGVAHALNQIFQYAIDNSYDWVLTLDQDSVCHSDIVKQYLNYIDLPDIGILCCNIVDRNIETLELTHQLEDVKQVDRCITSGSFCSVDAYLKTEGFDNKLFIDEVDVDYCYKLKEIQYKIYRIKSATIMHELGKLRQVHLGRKEHILSNYSPMRRYYMGRNQIYIARKYPNDITPKRLLFLNAHESVWILIYEKERFAKVFNMWKGVIEGMFMPLEDK